MSLATQVAAGLAQAAAVIKDVRSQMAGKADFISTVYPELGAGAAKVIPDPSAYPVSDYTLTQPTCEFTLPTPVTGPKAMSFDQVVRQDATGGRAATWKTPNGSAPVGIPPVLNPTPNGVTVVSFFSEAGVTYFANGQPDSRYVLASQLPQLRIRTSDSAKVNNSVALVLDTVLTVPVKANTTYGFVTELVILSATAADLNIGFDVPAGTVGLWTPDSLPSTASTTSGNVVRPTADIAANVIVAGTSAATPSVAKASGAFTTGNTAGNITVRFSQGTAQASDSGLGAWSKFTVTERVT